MRKIVNDVLLQMLKEGKVQKEIAKHFKVSPAAICKAIKKLNQPDVSASQKIKNSAEIEQTQEEENNLPLSFFSGLSFFLRILHWFENKNVLSTDGTLEDFFEELKSIKLKDLTYLAENKKLPEAKKVTPIPWRY